MKRIIAFAVISALFMCLPFSAGMAQSTKTSGTTKVVKNASLPKVQTDTKLRRIGWDLDKLFEDALDEIPAFVADVPDEIQRVSVIRIDGDENIYVNTVSLKYKIQDALIRDGRFRIVECRQCNNMKIYVEDESLILSRAIETNEQIAELGEQLRIDAYIQGVVTINETIGKVQLGLMLIDINDGTILKSTSLNSFYVMPKKEPDVQQKTTTPATRVTVKKDTREKTDLNLERLFPQLLNRMPELLSDLPTDIERVAIAEFRGDPKYQMEEKRLRELFESSLVNESGLVIIDCPTCKEQHEIALKEASVYPTSASTSKRMRNLANQLGFDAYIHSDVKIHEEDQKLELMIKVVDIRDSSIIKSASVKTRNEERILEKDREHSIALIPSALISLSGDSVFNGSGFTTDGTNMFYGAEYRYMTKMIFDEFFIGIDVSMLNSSAMSGSATAMYFLVKYRIPFYYNDYRLLNVLLGVGSALVSSSVTNCASTVATITPMKAEINSLITPSLTFGLSFLAMGSHSFNYGSCSGYTPSQRFAGDGLSFSLKYNF